MVYATTINPLTTKGPILHERRRGLITAIQGDVTLVTKEHSYEMRRNGVSFVIEIPANTPFSLINSDPMLPAIIINCPDKAWHPDDEDTIKFDGWDDVP
jgi:mannose-6-phosphate isomerase-like protein (cupin superfamily)